MPRYKWMEIEGDVQALFDKACTCPGTAKNYIAEFEVDEDNRIVTPVCRKCGQDYRFNTLKMKVEV